MKNRFYKFLVIVGSFLSPYYAFSQQKAYTFEQMELAQKQEKRISIVFIHTDWCKYCKAMENTFLNNEKIRTLLDENFYFISFNAEEKSDIKFNNQVFSFKPNGRNIGFNELNEVLSNGENQDVFPRLVLLNSEHKMFYTLNGYLSPKELEKVLKTIIEHSTSSATK